MDTITNRHKGKRFFIGGSSPNIKQLDPAHLTDGVVIAVNQFIDVYPRADYWMAYDSQNLQLSEGYADWVSNITAPKFMRWDPNYSPNFKQWEGLGEVTHYHCDVLDDRYLHREWSQHLIHIGTTASEAVHLAAIMGASEIVLWGVDLHGGHRADGVAYADPEMWGRFVDRFSLLCQWATSAFDCPIYKTNLDSRLNLEYIDMRFADGKTNSTDPF